MISHPEPKEYPRVGELLIQVDPYIYPALINESALDKMMPCLIHAPGSPFAPEHIWVARENGKIRSIMVAYVNKPERPFDWSGLEDEALGMPESYRDVCERYLEPMLRELGEDEAYVACLATDPSAQGRGLATIMLNSFFFLSGRKPVVLDVVQGNEKAIRLYENLGLKQLARL